MECTKRLTDVLEFRTAESNEQAAAAGTEGESSRVGRVVDGWMKKESGAKKKQWDFTRNRNAAPKPPLKPIIDEPKPRETSTTTVDRIDSHHDAVRLRPFSKPPTRTADQVTYVAQRLNQPHQPNLINNLSPLPRPLTSRFVRRCPLCDKQLIRPQGGGGVGFRIDRSACFSVPAISLLQLPAQRKVDTYADILFMNPRYEMMTVTLNILSSEMSVTTNTMVGLPESSFQIAPIAQRTQDPSGAENPAPAATAAVTGTVEKGPASSSNNKLATVTQNIRNTVTVRMPIVLKENFVGVIMCGFLMSVTYVLESNDDKDKDRDKEDGTIQVTTPVWLHLGVMK